MIQGYYCLIQYCPDRTRLEVCNLGVMLSCPEIKFLEAMMAPDEKRVRVIFGSKHRLDHIQSFKKDFLEWIAVEKQHIFNLAALNGFIGRLANSFRITEPRSIAVDDPKQDLADLFVEVFGKKARKNLENRFSHEVSRREGVVSVS